MTVKELKMMLNDMPDDAILLTRSALDASEFEQVTARETTKHLKAPMVPTNARPSSISAMQRKPARIIREIIRG